MTGDNTTAMKKVRAYERLMCAIIEKKPQKIIWLLAGDYVDSGNKLSDWEGNINTAIEEATEDSKNYYSHRQGGRSVIVPRQSPLGRKLSKGAFSPAGEEA